MLVDDGVEGQTVAPRGGEVPDVDVVVAGRLHLAPEQQGILGGPGSSSRARLFDGDLLNLEPQDDGPDEAEGEPGVPVHDIVGPHVLQVHPLLVQEADHGNRGTFTHQKSSRNVRKFIFDHTQVKKIGSGTYGT